MKRFRLPALLVLLLVTAWLGAWALAGSHMGSAAGLALIGASVAVPFIVGWKASPPDVATGRMAAAMVAETASELRNRADQQEAVARLGQTALASKGLSALLAEAVETVRRVLQLEVCSVAELQADGKTLLIRAGVGWPDGIVGNAVIPAGPDSQSGYTLLAAGPVTVTDFANETRFHAPQILLNRDVVSGISVPIAGSHSPFGVLSGQSRQIREFSENEVNFLMSVANVIGTAVERRRASVTTEQLAAVVSTSSDAIITMSLDGTILSANAACLRLYGYREPELVGQQIDVICTDSGRASMRLLLDRIARGETVSEFETERLTRSGAVLTVLVSASPLRNEAGEVAAMASIARDVTVTRQAEELRIKLLAAEETSRVATNLLSMVSHELRTPLTAVRGFASTILDYGDRLSEEEKLSYVQSVDDAAKHLEKMVADLLTLSRIDAGALRLDRAPLGLAELARVVTADFAVVGAGSQIELQLADRSPMVDGDISRLRQVLTNLIDNAIKYSAGGPVEVRVSENGSGLAEISVRDHGEGVPEDKLEAIFDTFYRLRAPATAAVKGTGLGLAICRGIVQAHGGSIWANLPEGGGLEVKIALPLLAKSSPRLDSAA